MDYYINPTVLSSAFTLPSAVADRHLKFASGNHLKVIVFLFRNIASEVDECDVASACGIDEYEVKEALLYWTDAGILLKKECAPQKNVTEKSTVLQNHKPTRNDVALRGKEDSKIRYLLSQAQLKLGRNLKSNETSTLVWLYDDEGLDVSLILLIIQYAVAHNKANMRFIESTAVDWIERGITDVTDADEELRKLALCDESWLTVSRAFGLERRKPSKKEAELSYMWLTEWGVDTKMLENAYDACVTAKSKFSFPYVAKIIESWHEKGISAPEEKTDSDRSGETAYDIDLFETMLKSKD